MIWWVYFSIVLVQILVTYPQFSTTCISAQGAGLVVYILHHFLDVFVFWSFLFLTTRGEHLVHLLVIIGVALHWLTNNYECIATTYMNELCGYARDQWLDSLVNRLRPFYYTHIVWLVVLAIYDFTRYAAV
jgi:hypothetical protein